MIDILVSNQRKAVIGGKNRIQRLKISKKHCQSHHHDQHVKVDKQVEICNVAHYWESG